MSIQAAVSCAATFRAILPSSIYSLSNPQNLSSRAAFWAPRSEGLARCSTQHAAPRRIILGVTWEIWIPITISVAGGVIWKSRALPLPILYVAALFLVKRSEGAFVNHSGNGDNLEAVAIAGSVVGCAIGLSLVCVGWILRVAADRHRRGPKRPDEARLKH
jgi:hypothetical protein